MLNQDSRRLINQSYQEKNKSSQPNQSRSNSNNAIIFNMESQQQRIQTDIAINPQVSIKEVRQKSQNQRRHSTDQGGENNSKFVNQQQHYDFIGLMKNFHSMQYTNEKLKERQKNSFQDKSRMIQLKETQSQEKQSKTQHNSQTRQIKQNDNDKEQLFRLNKTEAIQVNNKNGNNKMNSSEIRERMKNYPQKSSSPQIYAHNNRPRTSMEDKNVTIMSLQLKDIQENIEYKDIRKICYDMGYHLVKFDKDYNKVNNRSNGHGCLQIRGNSNDNKFMNLQTNLSKKGISLIDQNQNLKDFISNKYLLKKQEFQQNETQANLNQDEKLFNNFLKFQRRQKGQFI